MIPASERFYAVISVTVLDPILQPKRCLSGIHFDQASAEEAARSLAIDDTDATFVVMEITSAFRATKPQPVEVYLRWPDTGCTDVPSSPPMIPGDAS